MPEQERKRGYESYSHEARPAVRSLIWVTLIVVVSLVAVGGLQQYYSDQARRVQEPMSPFRNVTPPPPEPRLQSQPRDDMETLRRREEQALKTYGWIDREAGVVRVPIERAMELTAKEAKP